MKGLYSDFSAPAALLYNPENDLALASGLAHYTPPRQAQIMRRDGAMLPLWYGRPGDCVIASGVNAGWLSVMCATFGIEVRMFDGDTRGLRPSPWGWSEPVSGFFERLGFPPQSLPDEFTLGGIRNLSHRATSRDIALDLVSRLDFAVTAPAVCVTDEFEAMHVIEALGDVIIKTPWSNAGRGIIPGSAAMLDSLIPRLRSIIKRYGSVMIEPRHRRALDFAMLYESRPEGMRYVGLSVFDTDANGAYLGNLVADDSRLTELITRYIPHEHLEAVSRELAVTLHKIIGDTYLGPLGVDMLIAEVTIGDNTASDREGVASGENTHGDGTAYILDPCVELNLRMTMGHVAHRLAEQYVAPGVTARLCVTTDNTPQSDFADPLADAHISDGRLCSGSFRLNPLSCTTAFTLSVK